MEDDLGERAGDASTGHYKVGLRLAMLQHPFPTGSPEELRWFIEETDALQRVRPGTSTADPGPPDCRNKALGYAGPTPQWDGESHEAAPWVPFLSEKYGEARIETWDEATPGGRHSASKLCGVYVRMVSAKRLQSAILFPCCVTEISPSGDRL